MRFLWRWLKRGALLSVSLLVILAAPPAYVELACQGTPTTTASQSLITDPAWQRAESRTLLTYPEWHIVHAYDDYARVIRTGEPQDFAYLPAIAGFWTTLCPLTEAAAAMGGVTSDTKATIYTIGVSFTAELLAKAAYEETLGRLATMLRGPKRSPLDELSAQQATEYARFLQQTPWYKWDFHADRLALKAGAGSGVRDLERRFALGAEYRVKALYAGVIQSAVDGVGEDQLRLRSVISGTTRDTLESIDGVTIVGEVGGGFEIETDRYRAFTRVLERIAASNADVIEIAGNDEILITVLSGAPVADGALYSFRRQGYGDFRHLLLIKVRVLADRLRSLGDVTLEHVHDY